ncbi:MAG: hypothetical protein WC408_03695 [Candidatus Micrarchaeia archaeon]
MGFLTRIYYGGTDLAFGLLLLAASGSIPGGYADLVATVQIVRGVMTLSRIAVIG